VLDEKGVRVHDGLNALIRFADGAIANVHSSWIHPDSYPVLADGMMQIIGSTGTLTLDNSARRILAYTARGSVEQIFRGPHTADEVDGRIVGAFAESVGAFLASIRTGTEPDTSPRRSLPVARAQAAVIQSISERGPVRIRAADALPATLAARQG
jgi:predicted dehydrogenase